MTTPSHRGAWLVKRPLHLSPGPLNITIFGNEMIYNFINRGDAGKSSLRRQSDKWNKFASRMVTATKQDTNTCTSASIVIKWRQNQTSCKLYYRIPEEHSPAFHPPLSPHRLHAFYIAQIRNPTKINHRTKYSKIWISTEQIKNFPHNTLLIIYMQKHPGPATTVHSSICLLCPNVRSLHTLNRSEPNLKGWSLGSGSLAVLILPLKYPLSQVLNKYHC